MNLSWSVPFRIAEGVLLRESMGGAGNKGRGEEMKDKETSVHSVSTLFAKLVIQWEPL